MEAPDARLFRVYYPSIQDPPQHFCPGCWAKREKNTQRHEVYAVVALLAVLVVGATLAPAEAGGGMARLAGLIVLIYCGSVILHELGHAGAAWLLGMHVFRISIGTGPKVLSKRVGRTSLELHAIPMSGFVQPGDRSLTLARTRQFLVTFAGPATNIGLAGVAWAILGSEWRQSAGTIDDITPAHLLAGVNAMLAATSLIPMYFPGGHELHGGRMQPNDGMLMLLELLSPGRAGQWWLAAAITQEVEDLIRRGQTAEARAVAERGLERYPDVAPLRLAYAHVLTQVADHAAAIGQLRELLARPKLELDVRLMASVRLAEAHLDLGDPEDLAEADRLSRQAFETAPQWLEAHMIRGRVLVATGWVAKGCQMLRESLDALADDEARARCACYLAQAEFAQGDQRQAQRYLDLARSLDADCPRLQSTRRISPADPA
jgi:Zn-dependent protease